MRLVNPARGVQGFPMSEPAQTDNPTPYEKLCDFTRQVLSVPKSEIDRRAAEQRKARAAKRSKGK